MRSRPLLVNVLVSLVPIDYLSRVCDLIFVFQISPPANVVFSGIGILLSVSHHLQSASVGHRDSGISQAAKDVDASQDVLIDIFVCIEGFFMRLVSYTEVRPTAAMTDVIVKIITEVLSILAIATKEIKRGRSSKYDRRQ